MITREQALDGHSPRVWGLIGMATAAAFVIVGTLAWNAWDRREQLLERAHRLLYVART